MMPKMSQKNTQSGVPETPSTGAGERRGLPRIDAKHEPHRLYQVVGSDGAEIEQTAREVAAGSQMQLNWELWSTNFDAVIKQVIEWCAAREKLRAAMVDIRSNKVLIYFILTTDRYDLALGDEITNLEVSLGSAGVGHVEALPVPARSIERFAGPRSLIFWRRNPNDPLFSDHRHFLRRPSRH